MGSAGGGVDCVAARDSRDAEGRVVRDCGDCVARFGQGAAGGGVAWHRRRRTARTRSCLPIRRSRRSTIPCRIRCTLQWTTRAAEAGKHVLCEKPIGVTAADAESLIAVRDRTGVKIEEAFMVRTHPRWLRTRELIRSGRIGELRVVARHDRLFQSRSEEYSQLGRIRRRRAARYRLLSGDALAVCFRARSRRAFSELIERDPRDEDGPADVGDPRISMPGRLLSRAARSSAYVQRMAFLGTGGRIEIDRPVNPPNDQPSRILIDDNPADPAGGGVTAEIDSYVRPVHDSGRPVFARDSRGRRGGGAAGGFGAEYARD